MDHSDLWQFDLDDTETRERFATVLTMAADDLLTRIAQWPVEPVDSLSDRPVFRVLVEQLTRTGWFRDAEGRWDYRYGTFSPVTQGLGEMPEGVLSALLSHHRLSLMVEVTTDVAAQFARHEPFAQFATRHGFEPFTSDILRPFHDPSPGIEQHVAESEAVLILDRDMGPVQIHVEALPEDLRTPPSHTAGCTSRSSSPTSRSCPPPPNRKRSPWPNKAEPGGTLPQ